MKKTIIITFLLLGTALLQAQETLSNYIFEQSKIYLFQLQDESELVGQFIEKDSLTVSIKTTSIPKIVIPFATITSIEEIAVENIKEGVYWFPNPNPTRYLFAPSAFGLKKGTGYYQNTYLVFNSFNYGLTDNITIGGGFEFISLFANQRPLFFITPKITTQVAEKVNIGGGLLYANIPSIFEDNNSSTNAGIVYGVGTYGTPEHNVTGGLGWGFIEGDFSNQPIITISGMTRVGRRFALVTENWIVPSKVNNYNNGIHTESYEYHGLFSYGIRFFGEKMAVDLAFLNNKEISEGFILGIPYLDFVVQF